MPRPEREGVRLPLTLALYLAASAVYAADRLTKVWAENSLAGREPIVLIPKVVRFRFVENPGGAFSLFGGLPWLFVLATGIAVVAIVWASRNPQTRTVAIGLGLILGGALGNLTDRAIREDGFSGSVVDFIDFHVWPVFNVADMGIVIGAALVVLGSARRHRQEPSQAAPVESDAH